MSISDEYTVRDYYRDIELHARIALNEMGNDNLSQFTMHNEIEYRTPLIAEKFLMDPDNVETDLRRCISNMRMKQ